jgi:Ca2+-binding EF-hand superfamily protein
MYDLDNIEEEEKNNQNNYKNKKKFNDLYIDDNNALLNNKPNSNYASAKTSTIELQEDYNLFNKKYNSPKKYYINSRSDNMGSTLSFSTSPSYANNYTKTYNINTSSNSYTNNNNNTLMNRYRNAKNNNGYKEGQFNEYLKALMKVENEIEKGKIELSTCNDFRFDAAFSLFDKECKCCMNFDDLKEGLYSLDLQPKDDEILLLFNRFDPQKCCSISFQNFINVLLPVSRLYRNQMERKIQSGCTMPGRCRILCYDTKLFLKNLLKLIISGEKKMNKLREGNLNIDISNLRNIFREIDRSGAGYFYENDLKRYLIENGIFTDDKSCCLLFLKLDKNNDGKVDMCEMEDEFQPII